MNYSELLKQYGPNDPRAVKWDNRNTQYFRFKILCEIADLTEASVLDFGCGLGDLYDYLKFNGFRGDYKGFDPNKELIVAASKRHSPKLFSSNQLTTADYILSSGVFNEKDSPDIKEKILELYPLANKGLAVNAISTASKEPLGGINYTDPAKLLDWCLRNITKFVTLRHDYRGGNFTIYLYKHKGVDFLSTLGFFTGITI